MDSKDTFKKKQILEIHLPFVERMLTKVIGTVYESKWKNIKGNITLDSNLSKLSMAQVTQMNSNLIALKKKLNFKDPVTQPTTSTDTSPAKNLSPTKKPPSPTKESSKSPAKQTDLKKLLSTLKPSEDDPNTALQSLESALGRENLQKIESLILTKNSKKRPPKRLSELEKLQQDINEMFNKEEIIKSSLQPRTCTIPKMSDEKYFEKYQLKKLSVNVLRLTLTRQDMPLIVSKHTTDEDLWMPPQSKKRKICREDTRKTFKKKVRNGWSKGFIRKKKRNRQNDDSSEWVDMESEDEEIVQSMKIGKFIDKIGEIEKIIKCDIEDTKAAGPDEEMKNSKISGPSANASKAKKTKASLKESSQSLIESSSKETEVNNEEDEREKERILIELKRKEEKMVEKLKEFNISIKKEPESPSKVSIKNLQPEFNPASIKSEPELLLEEIESPEDIKKREEATKKQQEMIKSIEDIKNKQKEIQRQIEMYRNLKKIKRETNDQKEFNKEVEKMLITEEKALDSNDEINLEGLNIKPEKEFDRPIVLETKLYPDPPNNAEKVFETNLNYPKITIYPVAESKSQELIKKTSNLQIANVFTQNRAIESFQAAESSKIISGSSKIIDESSKPPSVSSNLQIESAYSLPNDSPQTQSQSGPKIINIKTMPEFITFEDFFEQKLKNTTISIRQCSSKETEGSSIYAESSNSTDQLAHNSSESVNSSNLKISQVFDSNLVKIMNLDNIEETAEKSPTEINPQESKDESKTDKESKKAKRMKNMPERPWYTWYKAKPKPSTSTSETLPTNVVPMINVAPGISNPATSKIKSPVKQRMKKVAGNAVSYESSSQHQLSSNSSEGSFNPVTESSTSNDSMNQITPSTSSSLAGSNEVAILDSEDESYNSDYFNELIEESYDSAPETPKSIPNSNKMAGCLKIIKTKNDPHYLVSFKKINEGTTSKFSNGLYKFAAKDIKSSAKIGHLNKPIGSLDKPICILDKPNVSLNKPSESANFTTIPSVQTAGPFIQNPVSSIQIAGSFTQATSPLNKPIGSLDKPIGPTESFNSSPGNIPSFGKVMISKTSAFNPSKTSSVILNQPQVIMVRPIQKSSETNSSQDQDPPKAITVFPSNKNTKITSVATKIPDGFRLMLPITNQGDSETDVLRPWLNYSDKKCIKSQSSWSRMSNKYCLTALYKCMDSKCCFYTSSKELFLSHLTLHRNLEEAKDGKNEFYLNCAYCPVKADSVNSLADHVEENHQYDLYNCNRCFYRTINLYQLILNHYPKVHPAVKERIAIKLIDPIPKTTKNDLIYIKTSLKQHVKPFCCIIPTCLKNFYVLEVYSSHLQTHKETVVTTCLRCHEKTSTENIFEHYFNCYDFGMFQCVYCSFGTSTLQFIDEHLTNHHPSRFPYFCERLMSSMVTSVVDKSSIDTLTIKLMSKKVEKVTYVEMNEEIDKVKIKNAKNVENLTDKIIIYPTI